MTTNTIKQSSSYHLFYSTSDHLKHITLDHLIRLS